MTDHLPRAGLAAVLDALPDPALLINSNGTVLTANSAACHAFRAPWTRLTGLGVLDLLPDLYLRRLPGRTDPADPGSGPVGTVRTTAHRIDASTFPAEVRSSRLGADLARLLPSTALLPATGPELVVARDLTDSQRAGAELDLRRAETEALLRASSEGILGIDTDGRCVLANPAALRLLQYRSDELSGHPVHSLVLPPVPAADPGPPALRAALTTGRRQQGCALLRRRDGRLLAVTLRVAPVRAEGQVVGAMMAFTDRGRELAVAADHAYLTGVLSNSLAPTAAALTAHLTRLARDPATRLWPEAAGELHELAEQSARTEALVAHVLAGRPAGTVGGDPPHPEPVALRQVLSRAVDRAGALAGLGRVRFSVHAPAVEVTADVHLLAEALAHLAADAAPSLPADSPPTVRLAGQRDADAVRIEITGPGDGGSTAHLPLAREMVAVHGGVLQPRRASGRTGITYVVDLPLSPVPYSLAAQVVPPQAAGPQSAAPHTDPSTAPGPGARRRHARPAAAAELPSGTAAAVLPAPSDPRVPLALASGPARHGAPGRHRAAAPPDTLRSA
ncbi:PAS domain-containing protein [Kitasatospora sp. NPDC059646]|uniref:PAS domain-containing protein n=1 Tax=Kitasatospora sp. NPDC059646 TaxID=3346893 RepID=UPI0036800725